MFRRCAICKQEKPSNAEHFQRHRGHSDGLGSYCRPCHTAKTKADYRKNRERYIALAAKRRSERLDEIRAKERAQSRKRMLDLVGITEDDYAIVLRNQGGLCGLCRGLLTTQRIDHDHKTGEFRGILCQKCNVGLGALGDDIAGLERAIEYLKKSKFVLSHRDLPKDATSNNDIVQETMITEIIN